MEKLQSSRPWMRKINESSMMARSDYNDVFGVPPWHSAAFPVRLVDYSEIFDVTASTSPIPVLDLSDIFEPVGDGAGAGGGRTSVDYLDIFGSIGGEGFAASYEELFAEPKKSGVSSSDERTRWNVLPEQQEKEAFKHSLRVYTENNEPNLEMNQHSSFPRQPEDVSSKKPSMSYHRMSRETIDYERKTKAANEWTVDNSGSTGYAPDGGQKKEAAPCFPAAAKNFAFNSPESISASLPDVPGVEKQNSRSHSFHSTSRGYILLHDSEYLRVSEISLQTKPCKVPPPSRPPPTPSMTPEHPKVVGNISRVDEPIKGSSFLHDAEMDPSSAAAVSIAAIDAAMEQAQVRLTSAKKLMDRKRDKAQWKVGPPNAMSNKEGEVACEVSVKSCSKLIDANNSLKERDTSSECTFMERKEISTGLKTPLNLEDGKSQLSSYNKDQQQVKKENESKSSEAMRKIVEMVGEWKTDKEYYELLRNGGFLNTVGGIYIEGDEAKAKAAIYSCAGKEKYCNDSEQAIEVQEKQKPIEGSVSIEKLGKDNKLKGPSMDCMEEANENFADATMDEFMLKDHANDLEDDYGSLLSDKNQKQSEARKDYNNENNANGYCEENELLAAEMASGYVEYKRGFDASQVKCEVNESNEEAKNQNESLFHIIADKEIKEQDQLCSFNTTEIEERTDAAEMHEGNEFQTNEDAPHVLVDDEFEQETIQQENGLVNGLEMPEAAENIEALEPEKILNKDCNEKETREARTAFQKDEESMGALFNKDVKSSEFLASAEGDCDKSDSENITEVPVLVETNIRSNSADEACQLRGIEESDTRKVLAAASDAAEISHVAQTGSHKPSFCMDVDEISSKMNAVKERDTNYEAHEQALAEARVIAERVAVERAIVEARQRALAEARRNAGEATEAEKASREARLRAERAAVERATEEARKRAIEKALAEKAASDSRERTAQVSASNKDRLRKDNRTLHFKATHIKVDSEAKHKPTSAKIQRNAQSQTAASSANDHIYADSHNNGGAESKLRCKARQEREQQTAQRAAKALAERNMRDILAQREQAERDRLAESLDGEVRRWSNGKDGNLRALLSTLQHILGPDSGWQPISPKDIMNASAVKKAYRKATLCVHPDKLQQRGASINQKHICERVFDLLQEAWNKFNSEER